MGGMKIKLLLGILAFALCSAGIGYLAVLNFGTTAVWNFDHCSGPVSPMQTRAVCISNCDDLCGTDMQPAICSACLENCRS